MIVAAIPANDEIRIKSLRDLGILDTPPEESGSTALTQIARLALEVPMALVNLIDRDRQWSKSHLGLDSAEITRQRFLFAATPSCGASR